MNRVLLVDSLNGRKNNLDFIRLAASIMVVFSHSYPLTGKDAEIFSLISKGQWTLGGIAVAIFFMISGFLVSRSFENSTIERFVKNRILRIFPGYIVAICVTTLLIGPLASNLSINEYFQNPISLSYFKNILLVEIQYILPGVFQDNLYPNAVNGSIWTIPYEVLCYIVVLLLGYYSILKHRKSILLLFITLFLMFIILPSEIQSLNIKGLLVGSLLELGLFFSIGMLFYAYRNKISINPKWASISILILFSSLLLGEYFKTAFLFFGSYLIFYFAYGSSKFSRISKYGDLSYGIYIYAFPIQQLVQVLMKQQESPLVNFTISMPFILLVAFISWHMVEKQALKLK